MKVALLTNNQPNQKALAHKLYSAGLLTAIITVQPTSGARPALLKRITHLPVSLFYRRAWFQMLDTYAQRYPTFPIDPVTHCTDVNDPTVRDYITANKPDLVLVSGTNLLRAPLINEANTHGRVMNLHTGISPFVKGGPNCTNWCLANREFALIGNTIMWIDPGIDSGAIIYTERTPLSGSESLRELHSTVMDHGHAMYVACVERFTRNNPLRSVEQGSLGLSRLYLTRDWQWTNMLSGIYNYYVHYRTESRFLQEPRGFETVSLTSAGATAAE